MAAVERSRKGCPSRVLSLRGATLPAWNDYELELRTATWPGASPFVWFSASRPRSDTTPWPSGDTTVTAANVGKYRSIILQAAHTSFDAELLDLLMFMAQLCLDHVRHLLLGPLGFGAPGLLAIFDAGQRFSSYALALIADRSALLVHEFGHMYLGGTPHCGFHDDLGGAPRWRSCFDVARRYLWTRVVAENGLPLDTYVPSVVTDGETDRVDPDFDREYPLRHFKLANPYWRYYPASVDDDYGCNRVQWGSEDGYSDWLVRKKAGDPDFKKPSGWPVEVGRAGCVGGTTSVLLDVGHQGG